MNTLIWSVFMIVTQEAAVHLGNDQPQRTVKQMFDVTRKLVKEQTEIQGAPEEAANCL